MLLLDCMRYYVHPGDAIPHMAEMPDACIDHAVFSPPFPSVYSYTSSMADVGNSEDRAEMRLHFSFFFRQLVRVMRPGRVAMVHCQQIVRMRRAGGRGIYDFRGLLIRLAQRAGFVYDYDWLIRKPPQAQAIRTKSRSLQFAGLESDRAQSRGALCDYMIKLVAPGDNGVPVDSPGEVSRDDWIKLAEGAWLDVRETETLNAAEARSPEDTRHICALQLKVIENSVRLYSNPGEIVFSPFAGIGSEGHEAVRLGRRFYGIELKPEYYATALINLARAAKLAAKRRGADPDDTPLFSALESAR